MNLDKFIILSDIHSNIYALNEFLNYIEGLNPKYILNCGAFPKKS